MSIMKVSLGFKNLHWEVSSWSNFAPLMPIFFLLHACLLHQASRLPPPYTPRCLLGQFTALCSPGPRPGPSQRGRPRRRVVTSAAPKGRGTHAGVDSWASQSQAPAWGPGNPQDLESEGFTHTGHLTAP